GGASGAGQSSAGTTAGTRGELTPPAGGTGGAGAGGAPGVAGGSGDGAPIGSGGGSGGVVSAGGSEATPDGGVLPSANLFFDPSFEAGHRDWTPFASAATLVDVTDLVHSGAHAIAATNRTHSYGGPETNLIPLGLS